jgi:membrane associated rhomboid family serine protease
MIGRDSVSGRITFILIGLNVLVFLFQIALEGFTEIFALTPQAALSGAWWQFVTYMFLHGSPTHLLVNMFFLFLFGEVVEHALGAGKFIMLYLVSGVGSSVIYLMLMVSMGVPDTLVTPLIGASGAVFGVLASYGLMFPNNKVWILFFPKPLPAFTVVVIFAVFELIMGAFGLEPGIANFGHFGGIVTGILITYYWKKTARPRDIHEKRNYEFFWE